MPPRKHTAAASRRCRRSSAGTGRDRPCDATGAVFKEQPAALLTAVGSTDPARHVLSVIAWADGLMFSCAAGSFSAEVPGLEEVRKGLRELLTGMLGT